MRLRRLVAFASLAVPSAILVHLAAEAVALGRNALDVGFLLRHLYLGVLLLFTIGAFFGETGIGGAASERRRRCALFARDFGALGGGAALALLICSNVAFFALTQLVEGVPIALGSFALGACIALAGAIGASLAVVAFGRSLANASLAAILGDAFHIAAPLRDTARTAVPAASRIACRAYSLFVPNRPPPLPSLR